MRSLSLNPTSKTVEKFGGVDQKGKKFVDFDGFCKIYETMKNSDELGTYQDFFEVLKVYDKHENGGKIMLGELENILLTKGICGTKVVS